MVPDPQVRGSSLLGSWHPLVIEGGGGVPAWQMSCGTCFQISTLQISSSKLTFFFSSFFFLFKCGPSLKHFEFKICFYWICYDIVLFYVLVSWPRSVWDLSSLVRDWTRTPCIGRQSLNHWTTREFPPSLDRTYPHRYLNVAMVHKCRLKLPLSWIRNVKTQECRWFSYGQS